MFTHKEINTMQYLKDNSGRVLGSTMMEGKRENIYDKNGERLGFYDGKNTFDIYSNKIGEGNLLLLLLMKNNMINGLKI